jgi:FAD/FMN-containing dehydrogenase
MNEATYQNSTQTARVGPGNRWQDVVKALSPYGRTVVGGRIGHVGVPGLLLGGKFCAVGDFELTSLGGLSFLSGQYGWASTHVVEYEVVLANGTVVKASKTANPELHRALQGGGSSLGIVTSFTLSTVPMGQVCQMPGFQHALNLSNPDLGWHAQLFA